MRNLIEFFVKNNHWFAFVIFEIISFVLLFQYNSYQGSAWFSSANAVVGNIYEIQSDIDAYFSLTSANKQLALRNVQLEQQVSTLTEKLADITKDSSYLYNGKMPISGFRLIQAKVVSNTLDGNSNLITINKGSVDGVKKDMGVVCGNGIVGIVYLVGNHYSVLIPILNNQSNISCTIKGRGYFGYLRWNGGSTSEAYIDEVPRHAHFKLYDEIVTSGYSSVFPEGILVGKILHVYNSADGLSYRLKVKLSTDFGNVRDVCVIDNAPMQERLDILRSAQDSIKEKND